MNVESTTCICTTYIAFIIIIIIIIIKEICTAPIFHIEWKHRALYNSKSNTYTSTMRTHTHACAHTYTHTHHSQTRGKNGCGKDWQVRNSCGKGDFLRAVLNDEDESE